VVVKTVAELFGLFVKAFDERVDVVFAIRAVETTAIERSVETVAESVRLILNAMKNPVYLFVV
jgi:hypothetical protein